MGKIIKNLLIVVSALSLSVALSAATPVNLAAGPWVTNVSETGFNVLFVSKDPCMSVVEIAPNDGSSFNSAARPRFYQTVAGRSVVTRFHNVRVDGLEKGSVYKYRISLRPIIKNDPYKISYDNTLSTSKKYREDFTVKTADYSAEKCRFSVLNDMHFLYKKYSTLIKGKTSKDMDFLLLNGDIVSYSKNIDSVAKYTFGPAQSLLTTTPVVYARGNHESRGADFDKVPLLFPSPTGEFYYIFRQGPVAFVVLDGGEDKPDTHMDYADYAHFDDYRALELQWLKSALKDPLFADAPVKVAILHIPPIKRPSSWHTQAWLADNFVPLLNEAGVDLMISGHTHKYSWNEIDLPTRSFPILVNSNMDRVDVVADASGITARIFDLSGNEIHLHEIKR